MTSLKVLVVSWLSLAGFLFVGRWFKCIFFWWIHLHKKINYLLANKKYDWKTSWTRLKTLAVYRKNAKLCEKSVGCHRICATLRNVVKSRMSPYLTYLESSRDDLKRGVGLNIDSNLYRRFFSESLKTNPYVNQLLIKLTVQDGVASLLLFQYSRRHG